MAQYPPRDWPSPQSPYEKNDVVEPVKSPYEAELGAKKSLDDADRELEKSDHPVPVAMRA